MKYDEKTGYVLLLHLLFFNKAAWLQLQLKVRKGSLDSDDKMAWEGYWFGFRMDVISLLSLKALKVSQMQRLSGFTWYETSGANGPSKVHDYLKEMNEKVFSKFDIMTVGETAELRLMRLKSMQRQWGQWSLTWCLVWTWGLTVKGDLSGQQSTSLLNSLKENLTKWQFGLMKCMEIPVCICNHDQPRIVSRLGRQVTSS